MPKHRIKKVIKIQIKVLIQNLFLVFKLVKYPIIITAGTKLYKYPAVGPIKTKNPALIFAKTGKPTKPSIK